MNTSFPSYNPQELVVTSTKFQSKTCYYQFTIARRLKKKFLLRVWWINYLCLNEIDGVRVGFQLILLVYILLPAFVFFFTNDLILEKDCFCFRDAFICGVLEEA